MKLTIDLPSVAVGGTLSLALLLVAGFAPQATQLPPAIDRAPIDTSNARPHPRDFVWLEARQGAATGFDSPLLTVPQGKILVVTGVGNSGWENLNGSVELFIDGVSRKVSAIAGTRNFAPGIPLTAGQTVQVRNLVTSNTPRDYQWLFGYLADA